MKQLKLLKIIAATLIAINILGFVSKGGSMQVSLAANKSLTEYHPLTHQQLKKFIKSKDIKPLNIRNIENYTIILYKSSSIIGCYILSSDQNGDISMSSITCSNDDTPISLGKCDTYGPEGMLSFSHIVINDSNLLKKSKLIKIFFDNKTNLSVFTNTTEGYIIKNPNMHANILKMSFYDKDMKKIYTTT